MLLFQFPGVAEAWLSDDDFANLRALRLRHRARPAAFPPEERAVLRRRAAPRRRADRGAQLVPGEHAALVLAARPARPARRSPSRRMIIWGEGDAYMDTDAARALGGDRHRPAARGAPARREPLGAAGGRPTGSTSSCSTSSPQRAGGPEPQPSRRRRRSSLPEGRRGSSSSAVTRLGRLVGRQRAGDVAAQVGGQVARRPRPRPPARRRPPAASARRSSGRPTTAASATAGWSSRAASTSTGLTQRASTLKRSSARPRWR